MATATAAWHGPAFVSFANKEIDYNTDSIRVIFSSSAYTPDVDLHDYLNDVTNIVSGTNISATGHALANCVMSVVGASNTVKFVHDDLVISNATATGIRVATFVDYTPATDATRPILGSAVFDADLSPAAAALTMDTDNANGTLKVVY
jgi:hypothetical protein